MPYRFRVRFAASLAQTLPAARGTFALTGRSATLSYVPNAVIEDTWTRLDTGGYVSGNERAGPDLNQGWHQQVVDTARGWIFGFQGYPARGANFGSFWFNPALGYWQRTNTISDDWHRNMGYFTENYDITFDPDRNCFWRSSGGPFGSNPFVPAGANEAGPWLGDGKYNIDTDEWSTPWPASNSTWVPLPADAGYFGTPGANLKGFDACHEYYADHVYAFGGWSIGSVQRTHKRNLDTGAISDVVSYANSPPWTKEPSRITNKRSGLIQWNKTLYTLADDGELWTYSLLDGATQWTQITTTGDRPNISPPPAYPSYTGGDYGLLASVDEASNCLVAWVGVNGVVGADGGSAVRKTWLLDLATRVWRLGPSLSGGQTVPTAAVAVGQTMMYDPVNRRTVLTIGAVGEHYTQVWALQVAPVGGIITSWPLPASSGSTYGANYYGFPYLSNGSSKHTNMAYCPLDDRLYVTGGDTQAGSATDGTWSMSMEDGSWRLDVGLPSYPTLAAPHAYQDGALFVWMPSRQKFLFGFGGAFAYEADGSAILNYSAGYWMYDPVAGTWEQFPSAFWPNPTLLHYLNGTGNPYGGVYDDDTDTVYVLGDSSGGASARRYNIATNVQDSSINYTVPSSGISGFTAAYFMRSRQCRIGRYIYAIGYYTNGVSTAPANCHCALWRYGIDDNTFTRLADPPAFTQNVAQIELTLFVSNGKIVHPRRYGPDGAMPEGIHIYNPANNTWETDTKTPAYGAFIYNSGCELPDGRIAMSGGVFGSQQTHLWFYEAT